uniref:Carbamate kinase n=1 Tax=Thermogemmatispora argillosa TaxID=2045280 RepID=A0A455T731_9CHLR|nr:carbamate kinase [Thermogemmatispora argillosa]
MSKLAVVALGAHSFSEDEGDRDGPGQLEAICTSARYIVDLLVNGWNVVIAYDSVFQADLPGERLAHTPTLASQWLPANCLPELQGRTGYLIQQSLDEELQRRGLNRRSVCLLTRAILRSKSDEMAPSQLTGPHGRTAQATEEARASKTQPAHPAVEVQSTEEVGEIVEQEAIKTLLQAGFIVIAAAGSTVPVVRDSEGRLRAVEARLHGDLAASFLATQLNADLFLITMAAEKVTLSSPQAEGAYPLEMLTLAELRQYEAAGCFAGNQRIGSKIRAAIRYLEHGGGAALITCPQAIGRALAGRTGTWILP